MTSWGWGPEIVIAILTVIGLPTAIATIISKRVRPAITIDQVLDQVQEERDALKSDLVELRAETTALLVDLRAERARSEAWRNEALRRRADLYRLGHEPAPLPEGLL